MSERRSGRGAPALLALRAGASLIGVKVALIAAAGILVLLVFIGLFITAASSAVGQSGASCTAAPTAAGGVPANYVPWLARAAQRYHLGPRGFSIVAAVHYVESDFGRSKLPGVAPGTKNYMGAMGPGQFLEESWPPFGVDADGDGVKDPYSVPDSIFATANLLHASGAPQNWHDALFSYNHAEWYVQEVLERPSASAPRPSPAKPGSAARAWSGSKASPAGSNRGACTTAGAAATLRSPVPRAANTAGAPAAKRSSARAKRALTARAQCAGSWSSPASRTPGRSSPATSPAPTRAAPASRSRSGPTPPTSS